MSNSALNWAWKTTCRTHTEKLVLVFLADRWNAKSELCFPSIPSIAAGCSLSERGVHSQLFALEAAGLLFVSREQGRSNRYSLPPHAMQGFDAEDPRTGCAPAPDAPPHAMRETPAPDAPPPPHAMRGTPARQRSVTQSNPKETQREPKAQSVRNSNTDGADEFDLFWKAYPRHVGKQKAKQEWAKAKLTFAEVEKQIAAWARSEDWTKDGGKFCPHPATWLHQRRWEDDAPYSEPERKEWDNPNPRSFIPANLHLRGKYCNSLRAQLADGDESVRETLLKLRTANADWISAQTPSEAEIARAKAYLDGAESIEEVEYAMFLNPELTPTFTA